jgi:hypothetical protein
MLFWSSYLYDSVACRKRQQQQVERGEFSPCGTPTGLDSRDPFDLQLGKQCKQSNSRCLFCTLDIVAQSLYHSLYSGARMFYNTQDMLWRRKLEEQADLQQALELQSRRLMSLQLLDVKKHHHRALSTGSPVPSPTHSPNIFNQSLAFPPLHSNTEVPQGIPLFISPFCTCKKIEIYNLALGCFVAENCSSPMPAISVAAPTEKQISNANSGKECTSSEENGSGKESSHGEDSDLQER